MTVSGRDPLTVPDHFWQRDDVAVVLEQRDIGRLFRLLRQYCGASQTRIGTAVNMTQATVSRIVNHEKTVTTLAVLERIADGLDMPDHARMRLGLAPREVDTVRRRTALGLGMIAALSPTTLTSVLRESAAEAMDFTRQCTVSSVGAGTLDHLEAVVMDLGRAYEWRPAGELFPVARAYRQRVGQLLDGKHTLREARELYVRAAHLSDLLSDLSHDLGSPLTAEAYAIDSYRHADMAGHGEAAAWASSALSSWSFYSGRADKAIRAAERGLGAAPRNSPIAARLHARAAKGYALQGNSAACIDHLTEARSLCERLPDESPSRFGTESRAFTSCRIAQAASVCYVRLADYQTAEREARNAITIETWSPAEADISRLPLAMALVHLGSPEEAAEHGKHAISEPRFLGGLLPLARQLDALLMNRYPTTACTQEFHERYQQLAYRALAN